MKFTLKPLATLLAGVALASSASADTITFAYGLPIVEATTEISQTGQLNKFNSALGNLTGISLDIFGSATTSITLTSNAATNVSGRANSSVDLAWSSSIQGLDALLVDDISLLFTTGGNLQYTPGQVRTFGPLTDDGTFNYDLSAISAALSGPGTFGITCDSISGFGVVGGGGNLGSVQTTTAGCGARITYTFDPTVQPPNGVPEPSSLALMGLALAGLGFARRKNKV